MRIFKDNLSSFTHWFAWTMSLVASIFFAFFMISEDIPGLIKGQSQEMMWFLPWMLLGILGTILSLWNRVTGGISMVAGGAGMVLYYYFLSGWSDADLMIVYGLPYILPGFLLLIVKK